MIIACIPAYNEESTIPRVIIRTKKFVDKIIVCDDGSTDLTAELAENLGAQVIRHVTNLGKGAALRTLFTVAQGFQPKAVVTLDSDGQHNPEQIPYLLKPILEDRADIVVGSRYLGTTNMPEYRMMGGKILDKLTQLNVKIDIKDTQSGFRALSARALEELSISTNGFEVESELLIKASQRGLHILEVPVTINYQGNTSTKNPVSHASQVAGFLLRKLVIGHPLVVLGMPGFSLLTLGLLIFLNTLNSFYESGYFSVPQALVSFTLFIVGAVTLLFSLTLLAINVAVKEGREK